MRTIDSRQYATGIAALVLLVSQTHGMARRCYIGLAMLMTAWYACSRFRQRKTGG